MHIDITPNDYHTLKELLNRYLPGTTVWAFGSRVKFTSSPQSDLDLIAFIKPDQEGNFFDLRDAFAESSIPFRVDLLNWDDIPENFKKNIQKEYVVVQDAGKEKKDLPKGWKPYKLAEITEINPKVNIKVGSEYPFIEMKDLEPSRKYVLPSATREFKSGSKFQEGDTLFARITPCLENGKISQAKGLKAGIGFGSTEFLVFRGIQNISDSDFIYYLTRSDYVRNNAIQAMTGTSGRQRVEKGAIAELEVSIPEDITEQQQIASILSSLDDKIELNLQMNQTLEAMAQAIFNEWFVKFNFPGFDGKLVGGLPREWRKEPIDSSIEFLNGLALQKFPTKNATDYLPVIKIRELRQGITESSDKASIEVPKKYIIVNGDVLFSWSGSLDVVIWCDGKGALNQHLFKVSSEIYPKWFYYYWTKHYLPLYQSIAEGKVTTMGHIQRRHLTETLINVPDAITMQKANSLMVPILEKLIENKTQVSTLTQIRDSLLPKLMSGKIEIKA